VFGLPVAISTCSKESGWYTQVSQALAVWKQAGVHVYLVPALPRAGTSGPDPTVARYEAFARQNPQGVTVIDAGPFVRDSQGQYQWRMPCVSGEAGCGSDGALQVRMSNDGGLHFCAALVAATQCPANLSGGQRVSVVPRFARRDQAHRHWLTTGVRQLGAALGAPPGQRSWLEASGRRRRALAHAARLRPFTPRSTWPPGAAPQSLRCSARVRAGTPR
jgi:hypothetical protein